MAARVSAGPPLHSRREVKSLGIIGRQSEGGDSHRTGLRKITRSRARPCLRQKRIRLCCDRGFSALRSGLGKNRGRRSGTMK